MWIKNAISFGALPAIALFCLTVGAAPSSTPRTDFWVPDGPIRAILEHRGVIYIAGSFEYISPVSETGGAFETISGLAVPDFPRFTGAVRAIVPDNAGGWFVGGQFTSAGGFPITNLAHIRADKTIDIEWTPNPDNAVFALASDGARLFVGGKFSSIAGQMRHNLAAVDPQSGTAIEGWKADCRMRFGESAVNALTVANGRLYLAGYFSAINTANREYIASLDAASGQVDSWHPNGFNASAASSHIDALAISGNVLYVGGTFAQIGGFSSNGFPRRAVAALDVLKDSDSVLPWNPGVNGRVQTITVSCGIVYLGGSFNSVDGQPRRNLAAVDASSGRVTPWNPAANGDVLSLTLAGESLYVGGKFTEVAGEPRKFLAQVDTTSGRAAPWTANADFGIAAITVSGNAIVAGGALGSGGKLRRHIAAFDAKTSKLLDFAPQISGPITNNGRATEGLHALAALNDTIYLGGAFTSVDGQTRNHLAAVAADGNLLPWNPNANGIIESLAVSHGTVYVGGLFTTLDGLNRLNLAAVDARTSMVTAWDPKPNGKVQSIQPRNQQIYVGGLFTQIGGKPRRNVAALRRDNGIATPWNPEFDFNVGAIEIVGGRVLSGGSFTEINGQPRNRAAAVNLAGGVACWDPGVRHDNPQVASAVYAISAMGGVVYLGGFFNEVAGERRNRLAAVSLGCPSRLLPWNPGIDNDVNVITTHRGVVYIGGNFQRVAGLYRPNFAVFAPENSPVITVQPHNQLIPAGEPATLEAAASGPGKLRYQWQFEGVNIPGATGPTLSVASVQPADSGQYVLVSSNRFGQVSSRAATITVLQPLTVVAQPVGTSVAPGATATLSALVEGSPTPYFQWRRNGVNIPGANAATLIISNARPTDGGSYEVVADNLLDAITSDVATLHVSSPVLPFADQFESRGAIGSLSGVGSGINLGATHQTNETNHAGFRGNSSIWIDWVAPSSGVATLSTLGSDFDTLLAVYTGATLDALSPIASDDDRSEFYTSEVSFDATAGVIYSIVVDGFSGASGNVVLRWDVDTSTTSIPRITRQPQSLVVAQSQSATFAVEVLGANTHRYQWFLGCDAIPAGTNSTLIISNVQPVNVGNYHVIVQNQANRVIASANAALEIGPESEVSTSDKEEDLPEDAPLITRRGKALGAPGIISVSAGTIDHQLFNNFRARTSLRETNHCRIAGGASRFLDLYAAEPGIFVIDTVGSTIDTVLAVYYRTNLSKLSANQIGCDNNGAPDGVRSLVRFSATPGRSYRAFVDGVRGSKGKVTLNWSLGHVPAFAPSPVITANITSAAGTVLEALLTNTEYSVLRYQWLHDGSHLAGATNATFVISSDSSAGEYSVIAENAFGFATNLMAVFTNSASPSLASSLPAFALLAQTPSSPDDSLTLLVQGISGATLIVESSPDLIHWTPFYTNIHLGTPIYIPISNPTRPQQFFRARTAQHPVHASGSASPISR